MSAGSPEEFGPYVVFEELGVGGMATVHRAESRGIAGFRRPVALKRMLPHCAASTDFVQAFVREARIASHLRHANVAQTYELGKVNGIYFIAMEHVPGKNLRQILKHCAQMTGPMPVAVTLNVLNQICDALDYAHNLSDESGQPLGIIHRDVSPSNIIVSDTGVVKLIDFGIAKASAAGMQTMSGLLKGKFGYMAPEYIAGSIDARADLFALGVIAHELLTNRPLFTGRDDMETLNRVRGMVVKPPSARNHKVPPEIDEIVMTALERDPERRWQQASALRMALTTMTKRLNLSVSNSDVAEWIDWAFNQDRPTQIEIDDGISHNTTGVREAPTRAMGTDESDRRPTIAITDEQDIVSSENRATMRHESLRPTGSDPGMTAVRPSSPAMGSQPPKVIVTPNASPNPATAKVPIIEAPAVVMVPRTSSPSMPPPAGQQSRPNIMIPPGGNTPPLGTQTMHGTGPMSTIKQQPPPPSQAGIQLSGLQPQNVFVSQQTPVPSTMSTTRGPGPGTSGEVTRVVSPSSLPPLPGAVAIEPAKQNLGMIAALLLALAVVASVVVYLILSR